MAKKTGGTVEIDGASVIYARNTERELSWNAPAWARHYVLPGDHPNVAASVGAQLNRGDEAGDGERLRRIVTVLASLGKEDDVRPGTEAIA